MPRLRLSDTATGSVLSAACIEDLSQGSRQMPENNNPERFVRVLGEAVLDLWSELPQELQHRVFERAVLLGHKTEQDESLREQLAHFLHVQHERTTAR
jgi:hypothetical protein